MEINTAHFVFYRIQQSLSESQTYTHNFEMPTQEYNNTYFEAYLCSSGDSVREPASVVCNDEQVIYFILRAHTGTGVSHT